MARMQTTDSVTALETRRPTIATIAEQMGLSKATVTHVLNGRAEQQRIRPETQQRVLEVARKLGYRANASARAIRAGRFGNIAFVQSLLGQYLPRELMLGLTRAIVDKDMHLVLTQVPDRVIDDEAYLPHTMRELSADGVLIYRHVGFSSTFLEQIHGSRIPAVFLNIKQESDCVHPDDLQGGRLATEYLLGLGHERIVYVASEQLPDEHPHYSEHDRQEGYRQAMASAGKTPRVHLLPRHWENSGQAGVDQRIEAVRALLSRPDRPTAIVAYELTEGMATIHAASQLGLRIPQDLSLIQFHNRIDDRYFMPIQTVSNMMEEVGAQAVGMLLEKITNPQVELPPCIIPVVMLDGATCMPPGT